MIESEKQGKSGEQKQSVEKETLPEKIDVIKSASGLHSAAALAATLSQGIVPHTLEPELYTALSSIGNYSFVQAVENKENTEKAMNDIENHQRFSRERESSLLEILIGEFGQRSNNVEVIPEMLVDQKIPDIAANEEVFISSIQPIYFDMATLDNFSSGAGQSSNSTE